MFDPTEIDPQRFCKLSQAWELDSDLSEFPRLAKEFTRGHLVCRVSGRADVHGGNVLSVAIQGDAELTCQRCLGGLKQELRIDREIYLARTEAERERRESTMDASSDVILSSTRLSLVELVEDEVLLALPLAPMHTPGVCVIPDII